MSSLSIMPRNIYPYFQDYYRIVQIYRHFDDFPERTRKMLGRIIENDKEHDELSAEEKANCLECAVKMSMIIQNFPQIADSLVNWLTLYGNEGIYAKEKSREKGAAQCAADQAVLSPEGHSILKNQ